MDIRQLKYFIEICDNKSFSEAAKNLHISQQGLSSTIKNLEAELGITLFERSTKGVIPTEFGNLLLEKSQKIVHEFDLMMDFLYDKANLRKKTLSVGLPDILYTSYFLTIIGEFQLKYPNIKLDIIELGSYECEKYIENNLLDISFAIKPSNTKKFNFIPISACDMMLIANKTNPLSKKDSFTFSDLRNEKFLMLSPEYKSRALIIEHCLQAGFKPSIAFTTSQLDLITELVSLNRGITVLPEHNSLKAAKVYDNVSVVPFQDKSFKLEVGFIVNGLEKLPYAASKLINYTLGYFKDNNLE